MSLPPKDFHLLEVVGVRVEMPANQPLVLLREMDGDNRYLPIWIGAAEASAIAFAQQEIIPPRPLTHDLFKDTLEALGRKLLHVRITELQEGVYYAWLDFSDGVQVSARPSDAIALAMRTGSPIYGSLTLLDEAGVEVEEGQEQEAEVELEKFREFLDQINPEDFEDRPS